LTSGGEKSLSIKNWSEEDRPREKLLRKGRENLTDAELVAILLGSGFKERSAVDVAKSLLQESGNDLDALGKLNVRQLSRTKGIGTVKALIIVAALELGRRRKFAGRAELPKITGSQSVWEYMFPYLADLHHEAFFVLLLNRQNLITKRIQISKGGVEGTVVDAKLIFKAALEELSSNIILCHNHPSGTLKPSQADKDVTKRIKDAGRLLDITVLDHLIFTNEGFYSFADEGEL
jgi:DNA repair protein RadC